jgi:DNA polymerase type B, organellar and viral.
MSYKRGVTKQQPTTLKDYKRLKAAFGGGDTHANYLNAGRILYNVASYDLTSDYPSQMCKRKYPSSKFVKVKSDITHLDTDRYAYLIMITLTNVRCITSCRYISRSRCVAVHSGSTGAYDNGRVISADKVSLCITEQDWSIIQQTYTYDDIKIYAVYRSVKRYLHPDFIKKVLDYYKKKTSLKKVAGMEDIYMQSKQYINSMFGMMVTDIVIDDVDYKNNDWVDCNKDLTPEQLYKHQQEQLDNIQLKPFKNILAYQWGVWVTAYARRQLWDMIIQIGDDVVYYDTDSVKFLHPLKYAKLFKTADDQTEHDLKAMCKRYNLDYIKDCCPATKKVYVAHSVHGILRVYIMSL